MTVYRLKPGVQLPADIPLDTVVYGGHAQAGTASTSGIVQLLGYQIDGQARAGETLHLLLRWQPLRDVPDDPDFAFFAHLRDRRGYTWTQADANGYAVVDWQPGVQVLQWLDLPLPPDLPPLEYTLVVGLEDRGVGQPLPMLATHPKADAGSQPFATDLELRTVTPSVAAVPPSPGEFPVPNAGERAAGELFTLHGYTLDPRFLEPGGSAHVALFWQAQTTPDADYTLALWMVSGSGGRVALGEREPLDGDYPTSRWRAGQWVRDRFDLILPPDLPGGLYQVFVGWQDPAGAWLIVGDAPGMGLGEIFIAAR